MQAFLSYSRRDAGLVETVVRDLDRARWSCWLDDALGGGETWWREILEQIRSCDVFIFALSAHSVRSRPCLAELDYALALGLPVLPLQISDVGSLRMTPIADRQVIDYRPRLGLRDEHAQRAASMIDLTAAVVDLAARKPSRPQPLPPEPPIPFEYLMQISLALEDADLPNRVQLQLLTQLRQALRDEDDPTARQDILDLLRRLRRHPAVTYRTAVDVDEILAAEHLTPVEADPPDERPNVAAADVGAPVHEKPTPAVAAPRLVDAAVPRWSVLAAIIGIVGIAQVGSLVFYDMSFYFDTDPTVPGYAFRSQPFLTTMAVLAVVEGLGVVAGLWALRMRETWRTAALAIAVAGLAVVAAVIVRYV